MSKLAKANKEFRAGKYGESVVSYARLLEQSPEMKSHVRFNIELAGRKMSTYPRTDLTHNVNPKVSIIIPAHNVEKYIEQCLASALNQTLKNIEIIVVDDGSTDATKELIESFSKEDERVKVISNLQASGNSGTPRNQALFIARGDYVAFLDADDYLELNAMKVLYNKAVETSADIVSAGGFYREEYAGEIETVNVSNRLYDPAQQPDRSDLFNSMHFPIVWFRIYKRDFLIKNNIRFGEFRTSADTPFSFRALCKANKVVSVEDIFYHYRFDRPGSTIERRRGRGAFEVLRCYDRIISQLVSDGLYAEYIPYVLKKAIGDWKYNNRFLEDTLKAEFESLMGSFLSLVYSEIHDWSCFSKYWKGEVERLYEKYKCDGGVLFKEYLRSFEERAAVSIVIPAHNVEKYIDEALSSIAKQSLENLEVVIVDDGSTDGTLKITKAFSEVDQRFKVISISQASGNPGTPRNVGIAFARGEYLAFVDADDWVDADFFNKLYGGVGSEKADIVTSSAIFKVSRENLTKIIINAKEFHGDKDENRFHLFQQNHFSNVWYRIYKKDFVVKEGIYFPSIYLSEDFCFSFVSHSLAGKINVVEACGYFYRYERPGSTTDHRRGELALKQIESHSDAIEYLEGFDLGHDFIKAFCHKKINSYWYTYSKLRDEHKIIFLKRFNESVAHAINHHLDRSMFSKKEWDNYCAMIEC